MDNTSKFPTEIDPLIFFQDIDLDSKDVLDEFMALMDTGPWDDAQAYAQGQDVSRYCADLFMLFQNRLKALQEFVQSGLTKPDLFRYSENPPYDAEVGHSWIDIQYVPATIPPGIYGTGGNLLKSWDDMVADGDVTMTGGVFTTSDNRTRAFRYAARVVVPSSVTTIGEAAFEGCQFIEEVELPPDLTEISERAFYYCVALRDITLPDSIETIGVRAFMNCDALTEITIPDGVTSIGTDAFSQCDALTTINYSGPATGYPWGAPLID